MIQSRGVKQISQRNFVSPYPTWQERIRHTWRIVWHVALIGSGGSGGLPVDIDSPTVLFYALRLRNLRNRHMQPPQLSEGAQHG